MGYFNSKDVRLFPNAYRGFTSVSGVQKVFNPEARLPSEYNLTNIVKALGKKSFILDEVTYSAWA